MAKWGIRRPFILCTLLLALFSYVNGITSSYDLFLAGRFFQGLVCGPFYVFALYLQNLILPQQYRKYILPINGCLFIVTPALGACWGGWISYEWDWRIIFYLDVPLALIFALFQYIHIRGFDELVIKKNVSFDLVGYISYFSALIPISLFIIRGQELDWFRSPMLSRLLVVGIISFFLFVIWELKTEQPILNLRLLSNPTFAFCLIHLGIFFGLYFGNIILLSLWLKFWANYTSWWINLLLINTALSALAVILFRAHFAARDGRIFWSLAIVFLAASSYYTTYFNVDIDFKRIAISRLLAGFGLAFFLPPLFRTTYGLYPKQFIDVVGLLQVTRALGSGLGAAIANTIWDRRQIFFNERLVSRLTPFSPYTEDYYSRVGLFGLKGEAATARLSYFSQREASSLALDDSFYLMFWILVVMFISLAWTFLWPKKVFNP